MAAATIARTVTSPSCKRPIQLLSQLPLQLRSKSSVPSSSGPSLNAAADEVYERASHAASTFDARYNLDSSPPIYNNRNNAFNSLLQKIPFATPSSSTSGDNTQIGWRQRQMNITNANPIKPHPKSSRTSIRPSKQHPPSFFPPYANSGSIPQNSSSLDTVLLHDETSIDRMRSAAQLARQLLNYVCSPSIVSIGTSTEQINKLLHNKITLNIMHIPLH